ncbi:MAG TPA: hypothetical protein VF192_10130 [Longimicrobiales bacterium]
MPAAGRPAARGAAARWRGGRRRPGKLGAARPAAPAAAAFGLLAVLGLAAPTAASAQEDALALRCAEEAVEAGAPEEVRAFCNLVAQGIEVIQPRIGLAATGGNPVAGTASTLGMRLGTSPRVSVGGRITAVRAGLPPIRVLGSAEDLDFFIPAIAADASLGLFQGFSPAITVGGVLSLDLLASAGFVFLPDGKGFEDSTPFHWGAGLRLGILRESFTLPGVSVSAMYRRVGDVRFVSPASRFDLDDITNLSIRGAIGKRVYGIALTAGAGYDHYSSDVAFAVAPPAPSPLFIPMDGFENDRFMLFANAAFTVLVITGSLELGWQQGGDVVPGALPAPDFDAEDGAFFASLAVRLTY